ncbi:MAG: PqqD family peptide modification chaperone [Gemmatimonadota bacterium]|nr:PqqD family peptide modification chaperone [Gemmatimonadota bacterium]
MGGETVILNLADSTYYGLDPVGTRVWDLVQEPKTVREVVDTLLQEYEVERDRCEQDILALLGELVFHSLIEIRDGPAS